MGHGEYGRLEVSQNLVVKVSRKRVSVEEEALERT